MMRKTISGFTIVELLIVIVVVAILAAISIVAYNGIQDRAEASKTVTAVKAYKEALTMYRLDHGEYPVTGALCLGDQFTAFTGQSISACRNSTSIIGNTSNDSARNLLKPYLGGSLPMPSVKFLHDSTSREYVGAHFYGSSYDYTLDNEPVVTIEYYVKGNTCPVGPVYAATPPDFESPSITQSQALSDGSRCYLLLPDN